MFGITAIDLTAIVGIPAVIIAAYSGWKAAGRERTREIASVPNTLPHYPPSIMLDASVGERIAVALEAIAMHFAKQEMADELERRVDDRRVLGEILAELKRRTGK